MRNVQTADEAYRDLASYVLENGEEVPTDDERTGTGTLQAFGLSYTVDTREAFPIITTKKVFFDSVVAEILWFLSGQPHIRDLQEHTSIWDEWADEDGELETAYGRYWRSFPVMSVDQAREGEAVSHNIFTGGSVDQIKRVVRNIKENPHSRRHVVTAWHPDNAWASKLPPCHFAFVFHVHTDGRLSLELHQRSGDIALGVPFNMSGYAFLLHLVADETGLEPGYLKHNITNAHVYLNHVDTLAKQIERDPKDSTPKLTGAYEGSVLDLTVEDSPQFGITGYDHHDPVKYDVAV